MTDTAHDDDTQAPRGARAVLAIVLALAVVASAAVLVVLLTKRTGEADELQDARDKVMSRARQFVVRVNTYGPDLLSADNTMPDYREQVTALITPSYATQFEEEVPIAEATVAQGQATVEAEAFLAGVAALDDDSATVYVSGQITTSFPAELAAQHDPELCPETGERLVCRPQLMRVEVKLVKVDGEWLVDAFGAVAVADDPSAAPSTEPSDAPTDGAVTESPTSSPTDQATP